MRIYIKNIEGQKMVDVSGQFAVELTYHQPFELGDVIVFETDQPYVSINIDPTIKPVDVYIPGGRLEYAIPFGEKKKAYHPDCFQTGNQIISMVPTTEQVLEQRRNLAYNGIDKRDVATCFPHSDANVMTRDESVFESRNAIDGCLKNQGHGAFPYQSWGGGLRDDLEFRLFFGRVVEIDQIDLLLRADYVDDHDIHWHSAVIVFSDGTEMPITMIKTVEMQSFSFPARQVEWIKLTQLRREVSASFSALSQIEVYGKDVNLNT